MPELIDRQAVLAEIGEFQIRFNETGDSHERVAYASAEHCMLVIKAAPTIEPEVRRGRWEEIGGSEPENQGFACSVCDFATTVKSRYCPNCGSMNCARMDGGADNA